MPILAPTIPEVPSMQVVDDAPTSNLHAEEGQDTTASIEEEAHGNIPSTPEPKLDQVTDLAGKCNVHQIFSACNELDTIKVKQPFTFSFTRQ